MMEPTVLALAYILDLAIGDPKWLPHPVKAIGWTITRMENLLRHRTQGSGVRGQGSKDRLKKKERTERLAGILLVLVIVGTTYGIFYVINLLLTSYSSLLTFIILAYLISTTLATRELIESAKLVIKTLNTDNIKTAREKLSRIVGRDTGALDRDGILKATIETLAENASDGVIAPLFYFSIGGLPLAMAYKAINTLDSMVGYKTEKYKNFGWASARLDDIANYISARITGILIVVSTFIIAVFKCPADALRITHHASRIMLHDGRNHPSPNSGVPEAAMAGALGIKLGGPMYYGGILVKKPYIGRDEPGVRAQEIVNASEEAVTIVRLTSLLGLALAILFHFLRFTV